MLYCRTSLDRFARLLATRRCYGEEYGVQMMMDVERADRAAKTKIRCAYPHEKTRRQESVQVCGVW